VPSYHLHFPHQVDAALTPLPLLFGFETDASIDIPPSPVTRRLPSALLPLRPYKRRRRLTHHSLLPFGFATHSICAPVASPLNVPSRHRPVTAPPPPVRAAGKDPRSELSLLHLPRRAFRPHKAGELTLR
jgi:hypothetical protein